MKEDHRARNVIIATIMTALFWLISLAFSSAPSANKAVNEQTPQAAPISNGLSIDRGTYTTACEHGYQQTGSPSLNGSKIAAYCGCTYDTGVARYGVVGFMTKLQQTPLPAEVNAIVNKCIQSVLTN